MKAANRSLSARFLVVCLVLAAAALTAAGSRAECPPLGTVLFPGVQGVALQESLRVHYRPPIGLSYATARDIEYSRIDNHDSTLTGIYSGFTARVAPDSATARAEAFAKDINAEHTWPQSKGAGQLPAEADMNQLRPSKVEVNAARANYPFAEIPDQDTDTWYRLDQVASTPDPAHRDEYSELDVNGGLPYGGRWEPRESVKGDVARGMFYFYTVYRAEADAADPAFFGVQENDLRAWTKSDPVDSAEYARACAIAPYQHGLYNPFVIDTTLVDRAYFPDTPVRMLALAAAPAAGAVRIDWETSSEIANEGFDVLRTRDGVEVRLTGALLRGGPRYTYLDRSGNPGARYDYWVVSVARDGGRERFGPRTVVFPDPPARVSVSPNPARIGRSIRFEMEGGAAASAGVYDLAGRAVRAFAPDGASAWTWDGRDDDGTAAAPGVYFLRVGGGGTAARTARFVLLR